MKQNGKRFSLTFDEWTSVRNRRYLNINIHAEKKIWNIGVTQVSGSMPAEKCIEVIDLKLKDHGLSLNEDIVCITTDGASVMKKVGKLLNANQQLCYAHGIQLGVISVLYEQNPNQEKPNTLELETSDVDDSDDEENNDVENTLIGLEIDKNDDTSLSYQGLLPIIKKIRKVVKIFRRSPTKNAVLQKYVRSDLFNKELMLILDSKTRWNSLLLMMERFLKLKSPIQKALIDFCSPIIFSDNEFNVISETISVLLPIKLAVGALCRQDANLLMANATIQFMLETLKKQKTLLSEKLYSALKSRTNERQMDLENVLSYLHDPKQFKIENEKKDRRDQITKTNLVKIIVTLIKRLYETRTNEEPETDSVNLSSDDNMEDETEAMSLEEKLQCAINEKIAVKRSTQMVEQKDLVKTIKREVELFEDECARGKYLELVYRSLLTIPPTSVESERAFSTAGKICTKIRSRLNDETVDALCFLRSHFKNNA